MRSSTIVPGSFSKPKFGYRYKVPKPVKKVVVEKTKEKKRSNSGIYKEDCTTNIFGSRKCYYDCFGKQAISNRVV